MEKFIKTTVGNSYNISLKNLLFRKKTIKKRSGAVVGDADGEIVDPDIEQRQFFCSELIAKAYKECGLLATDNACCQFFPADFSKENASKLKLEREAKLGDELMIMFDEEDIKVKRAEYQKEEEARQSTLSNDAAGNINS